MIQSKEIEVLTHTGYFTEKNNQIPHLFITIKNISSKEITIKYIFINDDLNGEERTLFIKNKMRPLPYILPSGMKWETWVKSSDLENKLDDLLDKVTVEILPKGKRKLRVMNSKKDIHVGPYGAVPNGTW
jgi:hypothetical protein